MRSKKSPTVYKKKLLSTVKDFFQYWKKSDQQLLEEVLDGFKFDVMKEGDKHFATIGENKFEIKSKKSSAIGIFLANIPYFVYGEGQLIWDLPEKVAEIQRSAIKLIEFPCLRHVTTLETYLILEMGLRSLYTTWLGDVTTIKYKDHKVKVKHPTYRRLKLYLRKKGWSIYKVKVNGEVFPFSQGSLLTWASKFIRDERADLAIRLAINVRNLLAHGELEWELYPTLESIKSSSFLVAMMFSNLKLRKS